MKRVYTIKFYDQLQYYPMIRAKVFEVAFSDDIFIEQF